MLILPHSLESHLQLAAETETSARAPWLFALLYNSLGLIGVRVLFWGGGMLSLAFAGYFSKRWRSAMHAVKVTRQRNT